MKKYFSLFVFILIGTHNIQAEQSAIIDVHTKIVNPHKISKNLNGGFIELLLDYVNGFGGMWAQEIRDRGFEEPNDNNTGLFHWNRWFASNENQGTVTTVAGGYNKSDKYQLAISNASQTESGVSQKIHLNDEISHYFYIYSRSINANNGKAKIILFDENFQEKYFEHEINISGGNWIKTEFEIPAIAGVYSPNLVISYLGGGTVYFDEVSLVPTNNFHGIRKEWADFIREWKPGNMRYPGGCWVDIPEQRWEGSIGHIDQRETVIQHQHPGRNRSYNQRYDFGLHEYMKLCEVFNMEPYLVTNFQRDIVEANVNFLEYCNSDTNTYWGKKRKENGHPEPFNVKYWEFGNEQYFVPTVQNYANRFNTAADLMKAMDSTVLMISNGARWRNNDYDFDNLMALTAGKVDIYGWHYATGMEAERIPEHRSESVYRYIVATMHERNYIRELTEKIHQKYPNLKLANTEWWSQYGSGGSFWDDWLLDTNVRNSSLEAGIFSAAMYLLYMQNPQVMTFASRTMGIGMFRRDFNSEGKKVIYTTPALPALVMTSNRRGDFVVNNFVISPTYKIDEWDTNYYEYPLIWLPETQYLDVTTSIRADSLFITVINRHPHEAMKTTINIDTTIKSNTGKIYEMWSEHYLDYNCADNPNKIKVVERDLNINHTDNTFVYTFPRHSVTVLAIQIDSVDIGDPPVTNDVVLYPNPTSGSFYINFENPLTVKKISIYNSLGQKVKTYSPYFYSDKIFVNNLNLPIGAYQVVIETSQKTISKSLIIASTYIKIY